MKANILFNKKKEVIGYRTYPLDLSKPVIEVEEFPKDLGKEKYKYDGNKIIKEGEVSYTKEQLLKAFIEYRNQVNYGIVVEDETTHEEILRWYKSLENGETSSLGNPPKSILKYLEANS